MADFEVGSRYRYTEMWRRIAEIVGEGDEGLKQQIMDFANTVVTEGELEAHRDAGH